MGGNEPGQALGSLLTSLREGGRGLPEYVSPAAHDHGGHGGHGEPGTATTVRTATHHGHEIRIETSYRVTIDGRPLEGHFEVLDNGTVHYHGLPNYAVPSAIDLMRLVIDHFGTEPPAVDELGGERR